MLRNCKGRPASARSLALFVFAMACGNARDSGLFGRGESSAADGSTSTSGTGSGAGDALAVGGGSGPIELPSAGAGAGNSGGSSDGGSLAGASVTLSGAAGKAGVAGKGGEVASAQGGAAATGAGAAAGGAGTAGCSSTAIEVCDGLDNDCDHQVDEGAQLCASGCRGFALQGRGYVFCADSAEVLLGFDAARAWCLEHDMHLVWTESAEENAAVVAALDELRVASERVWLGGSDSAVEGQWSWVGGRDAQGTAFWSGGPATEGGTARGASYANWGAGRPNDDSNAESEDCLSLSLHREALASGSWNDDVCSDPWPFICETF